MEVIIDGVRYVPDGSQVEYEYLSLYYMHDNHTFSRIQGSNLDEIRASAYHFGLQSPAGMLCPPTIIKKFHGAEKHEERDHGISAHAPYKLDQKSWNDSVGLWMAAIRDDKEVMRLIELGKVKPV